jgi:hypothetical protein
MAQGGQKVLDTIIKVLDNLGRFVEVLLNSLYKLLDYLIKAFEEVSRKILNLITTILRLMYYILAFILMIILGPQKHWGWMTITGWSVIILVAILFTRDFIAEFRGRKESAPQQALSNPRRVFITVLILNLLMVGYSLLYFIGGISVESLITTKISLLLHDLLN